MLWLLLRALVLSCVFFGTTLIAQSQTAGDFDYYLLALSWSPTFCAADRARLTREQCVEKHDFILHGLWPQYERGFPEFCDTDYPGRLPEGLLDAYDPMTPDRGLLAHQWRKHGSCSGLSPEAFFDLSDRFWGSVVLPDRFTSPIRQFRTAPGGLIDDLIEQNPGLSDAMVIVTCRGKQLDEVRICMSRDGEFRTCGNDVVKRQCRHKSIIVPPVGAR